MSLPPGGGPHVVRTDFRDGVAWESVSAAIVAESAEGFRASVAFVDDETFADASLAEILDVVPTAYAHNFLLVVDRHCLASPGSPVLVIDLLDNPGATFRAVPGSIQAIENNLSLSNMGFHEFASAADQDGVFLGFGHQPVRPAESPAHRRHDPVRDASLFHPDEIAAYPRLEPLLWDSKDGSALGIAFSDPELLEAIYDSSWETVTTAARRSLVRLAERAGIATLPWVAPALEAAVARTPLPPPFDSIPGYFASVRENPAFKVPERQIPMVGGGEQTVDPAQIALSALLQVDADRGGVEAQFLIFQVLYGSGTTYHREAINELRTDVGLAPRVDWPGASSG